MEAYSCCFTGHRMIRREDFDGVLDSLRHALPIFADSGVNEFICGGALGFDTLAAQEVLRLKKDFPLVRLSLVLPCKDQSARWTAAQKETYASILEKADHTECLFDKYVPGCMQMRNRRMVDRSHVCIAYYTGRPGGTDYTVKYAKEKGVRLLFVPMKEESVWEA
ncbi:MAG: DUF1273 domain-containing protein [Ruminococcaceae bacterium]|nr:DUF1273 domain-containing protein [Oscillospiraceae bacterium]